MSTRCQIAIFKGSITDKLIDFDFLSTNWEVLLYRHYDGYQDAIVPDILPLIKQFMQKRGADVEYLGACLITYLKYYHCGNKYITSSNELDNNKYDINLNDIKFNLLTHGICKKLHTDIEYFYAIDSKNLYVFRVGRNEKFNPNKFVLIESHSIIDEDSAEDVVDDTQKNN